MDSHMWRGFFSSDSDRASVERVRGRRKELSKWTTRIGYLSLDVDGERVESP